MSTRTSLLSPRDDLVRDHLHFFVDFVIAASHKPLDRKDGVFRVGDSLTFGHLTYQPFTTFGESNDGRSRAGSFLVGDDGRLSAFHNGDDRIGGSQIDSDNFTHKMC